MSSIFGLEIIIVNILCLHLKNLYPQNSYTLNTEKRSISTISLNSHFTVLLNIFVIDQSLVGLVVIGAELDREDHGSIPVTAIGRGLESLDAKTDPRTRLNWW
jgi:hypothetical protein